jgi:hypothetical protein
MPVDHVSTDPMLKAIDTIIYPPPSLPTSTDEKNHVDASSTPTVDNSNEEIPPLPATPASSSLPSPSPSPKNNEHALQVASFIFTYKPPVATKQLELATYSSRWEFKGDCKNNDPSEFGNSADANNAGPASFLTSKKTSQSQSDDSKGESKEMIDHTHHEHKGDLDMNGKPTYIIPEALLWMNPFQRLMLYLARQEKVDNNTWQCLISISLVCLCLSLCLFPVHLNNDYDILIICWMIDD